jgi:Uma2 family endonuclease
MDAEVGTIALIVEYVAPDEGFTYLNRRVSRFLKGGVPVVCHIIPEEQSIIVFRQHTHHAVIQKGEDAKLAALLPDFRCSMKELFADNGAIVS